MKKIIMINGTMGVGKTTISLELQKLLPRNVFLDGDWCWGMNPFIVTEETKSMVIKNIVYLLNNFISCSEYENIIFCWVMHQQEILDLITKRLNLCDCDIHVFSLICSESALIQRLEHDIVNNVRTNDIIERSITRMEKYNTINSVKIDVSDISPVKAAIKIKEVVEAK